jgi:hypothetical protein
VRFAAAFALAAVCLAVPVSAQAQSVAISGPSPTFQRLDLTYSPRGAGRLSGTQTIDFVNLGPTALDGLWLRLWANGPDRCRPRRISVQVDAPAAVEAVRVRCSALRVRLGTPVEPGAAGSLALRFTVRGRRLRDRFGRSDGVRLLANVIPLLAVTDARGTRLPPYTPFAESYYSLSSAWEGTLRLPARLRAATTGAVFEERVEGGERVLRVATPHARDFALAIGRWRTVSGPAAGATVRVHAQSRRRARQMLRVARRAVRTFAGRFGPYDSPELEVVEVAEDYGMEFPELVFSNSSPFIVAHEVAHQWWYSIVGNDEYSEPWLDESFATYSGQLVSGGFRFCNLRRPFGALPPPLNRVRLDRGMRYFNRRIIAYGLVVYDTGGCVLRGLERRIGRQAMTAFLRLLVSRHRNGVATKADVLAALAEAVPGFDTKRFLRLAHVSR